MKKHKKLGVDELRNFPGFESFTEEEAEQAIKTIEGLSILFYELFMKEKYENVKQLNQEENHETKHRPAA
ncbi:hypothetical protein CNR22_03595 [Sphingobacteriaceae bacterium]|nr:hypothetical protein CNR22_03595 [Sphingobacteriaceae bacterium]